MRRPTVLLPVAAVLAGCAHPWKAVDLPAGTPREQVIARAGAPTRVVAIPGGGQRLQYSVQPFGQHAFMVDLDAAGRLVRARQVLALAEFNRIEPDRWTATELEREFGRPARIEGVSSWGGPVWLYRWTDGSDMFYAVYLDRQGVVRRAHPGMEHVNAPNERH